MSNLSFMEKLLDAVEVKWKALGDVGEFIRGGGLQKKDFTETGVGCIHYGQIYTHYGMFTEKTKTYVSQEFFIKSRKAKKNDLIIATTSETDEDVCKAVAWLGHEEIAISSDACIYRHNLNPKYVSYFFRTEEFQKQKRQHITGTKVRRVNADDLAKIQIPIPCPENPKKSLEIQAEIVRILEVFIAHTTELTAELIVEITARKKQYNYYRDKLLSFEGREVEWKMLGDVGEVRMCKRIFKNQTSDVGDVPFYKIGTFGKEPNAFITREVFDEYKTKYSYPKFGETLISASGTIGRTVIFDGKDSYFQDSNIIWIENDEQKVLNKYLFHFYKVADWNPSDGGIIQRLYNDNLKRVKIPIPCPNDPEKSLAEQARVVAILDEFDALTNSITEGLPREIELRQKQYQYYRDLLLSFPKTEEVAA